MAKRTERSTVSASIPAAMKLELVRRARECDRSLSAEIRRLLARDVHVEQERA